MKYLVLLPQMVLLPTTVQYFRCNCDTSSVWKSLLQIKPVQWKIRRSLKAIQLMTHLHIIGPPKLSSSWLIF